MSNLGIGVLIHLLSGDERGAKLIQAALGKRINAVRLDDHGGPEGDGAVVFQMAEGKSFQVHDDGRSCCESRYLTTDDELSHYSGAELLSIELEAGPGVEDEYGDVHEQQFLKVSTSAGVFTVVTHNRHNGYYGGFWLKATAVD